MVVTKRSVIRNRAREKENEDIYTLLITKAPYIPGGDESIVVENVEEIEWLDMELIREGIQFLNRHFTMSILADTFALMFGFCVKPMSAVVLRTGKLMDPEQSFKRYLSTVQRIARFFLLSIKEEGMKEGISGKAFLAVRRMHKRFREMQPVSLETEPELWKTEFAEAMNKDLEHIGSSSAPKHLLTWNPNVPLSQFDMAVTQFGFIGVMWLFPKQFGIKNREKEMRGVLHLWAVIGRQLGLRDEFNVCRAFDPEVFQKLYENVLLESLKSVDETVVTIQNQFMKAFTARVPFMTYKAMLYYGLQEVEGYKGENLWKLMGLWDKASFKIMQVWFWGMRTFEAYRILMNMQTGFWLQWQLWRNNVPTLLDMGFRNLWKVFWM